MTEQLYLFIFMLVFFLSAFVIRSIVVWKNTGINPFTFGTTDNAHDYAGRLFKLIIALEFTVLGVLAFGGEWAVYLLPFWYLDQAILSIIGWGLLHASLIWILIAQLYMSDAWRIGIDTKNKTTLITNGLFAISRNPVFLGLIMANVGIFLVAPNAFTLLISILSSVVIHVQTRLEEAFLQETLASEYTAYCEKVRRWI